MIGGMLSMVTYNLADTYFVSRLGYRQLAAMTFTFPVVMTVGCVALGIGVGVSSVVSRAIGAGDMHRVRRVTTDALLLAVMLVILLSGIGLWQMDRIFRWLGAAGDMIPLIREYMTIWLVGMVFVMIPITGNNAIRASGDTLWPSLIMMLGAAMNIVLDPLLIFGLWGFPEMGLRGAAVATVFARATTMVASLGILSLRKGMLDIRPGSLREILRGWGEVLYVGIPAAATTMLFPLSMGIITSLVAIYGEPAVAAIGAGQRIESFAMMVIWSLSTVLAPFVGQNWSAGLYGRAHRAIQLSNLFSVIWGLLCLVMLVVFARALAGAFSKTDRVEMYIVQYLHIAPLGYGLRGVCILASRTFSALNRPLDSSGVDMVRLFLGYVPLAHLGALLLGFEGVFWGVVAANIGSGIIAWIWAEYRQRQWRAQNEALQPA